MFDGNPGSFRYFDNFRSGVAFTLCRHPGNRVFPGLVLQRDGDLLGRPILICFCHGKSPCSVAVKRISTGS